MFKISLISLSKNLSILINMVKDNKIGVIDINNLLKNFLTLVNVAIENEIVSGDISNKTIKIYAIFQNHANLSKSS